MDQQLLSFVGMCPNKDNHIGSFTVSPAQVGPENETNNSWPVQAFGSPEQPWISSFSYPGSQHRGSKDS